MSPHLFFYERNYLHYVYYRAIPNGDSTVTIYTLQLGQCRCSNPGGQGISPGDTRPVPHTKSYDLMRKEQLIIPLQFLWVLRLSCTKISILCLYLMIFPIRWVVWSSYATIFIIVAWTIATILAGCLIFRPLAFNWNKTIVGGSRGDHVTSFTVTGIINLITDVVVLLLPMQPLYQLQMATYKKVTLASVFGLGIFTCVISALRISVLSTMDFTDITSTIPKANIFSGIEPCLAVVLASVPMMHPLLRRSAAPPQGLGQSSIKSRSKSAGPKGAVSEDGFERLDDDTSHLWLRPMELQHYADASACHDTKAGNASEGDGKVLDSWRSEAKLTVDVSK